MIPFITETVWWRLNDVRPQRGLPGRIECAPSKRLISANWPAVGDFAQAAEHIFPRLQEIIVAIRNIRNEHQVNPKQSLNVSIRAGDEPTRQITTNREMIELLATCTIKDVRPDLQAVANAATATAAGCEIFVEGLVNADAEKQRLSKASEDTKKKIDALKGRLSNEAYIAKAPPHLVQQSREQLAAMEAELLKLEEAIKKLG
jgi:valyl-tRNA synthetase